MKGSQQAIESQPSTSPANSQAKEDEVFASWVSVEPMLDAVHLIPLLLQGLHPFFKSPIAKNLKAGGELAFGLASLTALTYPVVATFQALGSLQSAQAALGQQQAAQGQQLAAQGQQQAALGQQLAAQGQQLAAQGQQLAEIVTTLHGMQKQLDQSKKWW